ncbi:Flp family type IVb pilin [Alsobacter sp. SYSU BS001988]|jgi:pilus assembly protein Flp/PilA
MINMMISFFRDEEGATAIEYGLIAALIAIGLIGAVGSLKSNLSNTFDNVGANLGNASTATE